MEMVKKITRVPRQLSSVGTGGRVKVGPRKIAGERWHSKNHRIIKRKGRKKNAANGFAWGHRTKKKKGKKKAKSLKASHPSTKREKAKVTQGNTDHAHHKKQNFGKYGGN